MSTLWHGRFEGGPAEELLAFTVSLPFDQRLAADDLAGSRAHVRGLGPGRHPRRRRGGDGARRPRPGRGRARRRHLRLRCPPTRTSTPRSSAGSPSWPARPAPSSTPAAAATTRSPPTCACSPSGSSARWPAGSSTLQQVLLERAERGRRRLPARATPTCSGPSRCCWPTTCWPTAGRWPATSTGCSTPAAASTCRRSAPARWPARRCRSIPTAVAADLGFAAAFENSLDAVSDRDFVAEALFDLALLGVHLSRIGEEVVLWSTDEFGFLQPRRRLRHRQLDAAAEEEPRHRRAGPGQGGPPHRQPHRPAGHAQGPAARLQPRPAGGQGAAVRRRRPGRRWPWRPWPACWPRPRSTSTRMAGGGRRARPPRPPTWPSTWSTGACRSARPTPSSARWCASRSTARCPLAELVAAHPALGPEARGAARARRGRSTRRTTRAAPARPGRRAARALPAPPGRRPRPARC